MRAILLASLGLAALAAACGSEAPAREQGLLSATATATSDSSPVAADTAAPTATSVPPTATPVPPTATPVPPTATPVPPTPTPKPQPAVDPRANCEPSYPTLCIPKNSGDLDCPDISARNFPVVGSDPHRFDADHDGVGCER